MKERADSLLASSVEIESNVRKLKDKLQKQLAQPVNMESQQNQRLGQYCDHLEKSIQALTNRFQQFENTAKGLHNSSVLLEEKDKRIKYLEQLMTKKEQQLQNLQQIIDEKIKINEGQKQKIDRLTQKSIKRMMVKQRLAFLMPTLKQLKQTQTIIKNQVISRISTLKRDFIQSVSGIEKAVTKKVKAEINPASFIAEKDNELLKQKQKYKNLQSQFYDACYILSQATDHCLPQKSDFSKSNEDFMTKVINSIYALSFLSESKIAKEQSGKIWLMYKLKQFTKCDVKIRSRLLYEYSNLGSKVNFHQYIDDKPNILAIAHLQNGYIIGGFTVYPFSKATKANGQSEGFLFNLSHKTSFDSKPKSTCPVAPYDEYYFVLGNAQFRVKSGQLKLFSNFGIANSAFESGSTSLKEFMGQAEDKNQYQLSKFEIHQIWPHQ